MFEDRLYFVAAGSLWVSDGTAAGTEPVVEIIANSIAAAEDGLHAFLIGNKILFTAYNSDGTAAGTTQLLFDNSGEFDTGDRFAIPLGMLSGQFAFIAGYPSGGVVTTDGTASGTVRIVDVSPNAGVARDGLAYFDHGPSLWVSNGTAAGTRVLKLLDAPRVDWLENFNGVTLFETQLNGRQLWTTDGTEAGTTQVAALSPLSDDFYGSSAVVYSAAARQRLAIGNTFYLAVTGAANTGIELYAITNEIPIAAPDTVTVQGGRSNDINVLSNDSDPDGALLGGSVVIASSAAHGQLSVTSGGVVSYTPAGGFAGTDTFSYTVMDDLGGRSQPAAVSITVTPAVVVEGKRGGGAPGVLEMLALLALAALRLRPRLHKNSPHAF